MRTASYKLGCILGLGAYAIKTMLCDDFRGIAISPIISKVSEHCLLKQLQFCVASTDNQFGFKKALVVLMLYIRCAILLIVLCPEAVLLTSVQSI